MELFSLKDKVIVITGAAGLLGKEYAESIANYKGIPILVDINTKELDKQVKEINKTFNIKSEAYSIDITDEKSVKNCCEAIKNKFGKIDGLINNASNNPKVESSKKNFSRLENFSLKSWQEDISVSLTGSFICSKYFGFEISKNPNGGSIINVSSDLGLIAPNQNIYKEKNKKDENQPVKPVSYSVAKHGIIGLTRYISTYWAKNNLRCNAICPGGVFNNQSDKFVDDLTKLIPMGRMADKDEYNGLIIFLLSDASSYINGSIITADGGRTVW